MYFKHPELLYALFLLVIPILVHLFQLRRFKTTKFTNVKFLKKAVLQTRKSSKLKKFLVLCTRLLILACLIIAFAQPFLPPESGEISQTETVIYLDNSYSMQARGKNGVLLRRSVQDLLENLPENETLSLFTNDEEFKDISSDRLRERLQDLDYSFGELPWKALSLKAQNLFRNSGSSQKNFVVISDFQNFKDSINSPSGDIHTYLVNMQPENLNNLSIDSAQVDNRNIEETTLSLSFSAAGDVPSELSVGLYDGEHLLARKTADFDEEGRGSTTFTLGAAAVRDGRIEIDDNGLQFDNTLFFSINETPPVQVVVIGDKESEFLQKIYSAPEFSLNIFPENNIDYNVLSKANLVILNEPIKVPLSMVNNLQQLVREQVFLIFIPSLNGDYEDYNLLLQNLELPRFGPANASEKLITDIIFEHPVFRTVFNQRISNFEYPKVQSSFPVNGNFTNILKYQNGQPFLFEANNIFVFTAALNRENSNFKSAPLIVPTFYNIGNLAISKPELYHVLGTSEEINIQANLQQDEVLKLSSSATTFIPQQQSFQNKVELQLNDIPKEPGHYRVLQDSTALRTLSFNVSRSESKPVQGELQGQDGISVHSSIPNVFSEISSANDVNSLWKWFIIFALFFLIIELLILKFLK